jgi:hypothetical protein
VGEPPGSVELAEALGVDAAVYELEDRELVRVRI